MRPQSVYGRTKRIVEEFLRDLARAEPQLAHRDPALLQSRGRASVGACIGEAPRGRPDNLVPLLCRIAAGEFAELAIYGSDWPTPDGTGVRDYLHVQDLRRHDGGTVGAPLHAHLARSSRAGRCVDACEPRRRSAPTAPMRRSVRCERAWRATAISADAPCGRGRAAHAQTP